MLASSGLSHYLTIKLRHVTIIKSRIILIPVFKYRKFHRVEHRAEKHAGVTSVAGTFIKDGYLLGS